jgi:hypothetical protein
MRLCAKEVMIKPKSISESQSQKTCVYFRHILVQFSERAFYMFDVLEGEDYSEHSWYHLEE